MMKKGRLANNSKTGIIIAGMLSLLYLIFLIYLKYDLNDIPLKEIRFDYIGNLMNGFLAIVLIIALVVISFLKRTLDARKLIFVNILLTL